MTEVLAPAIPSSSWHPIAASTDLVPRHTFQGQLEGREFAAWRADDGNINVWENRCLHRGVRLSIGMNEGAELKCQYHGWRYANGSASCTYIPAHPANAPARQVTNRTFPAVERFGLVWSTLELDSVFSTPLSEGAWRALRAVTVHAPFNIVMTALEDAAVEGSIDRLAASTLSLRLQKTPNETIVVILQSVDAGTTIIRALCEGIPADEASVLRRYNRYLNEIRDTIEAANPARGKTVEPDFLPVSEELARMPAAAGAPLTAVVARKWQVAEDVVALELKPLAGALPAFQPGAHIDLTLPDGTVRQYSLTNGPGEWRSWTIGVKRDPASRGGSRMIAETLREGDILGLSEPRNNFPLRRDALRTVLIAGGIGLTPLLSMAKALLHGAHAFELHVFARSAAYVPFLEALSVFGDRLRLHLGCTRDETRSIVGEALGRHGSSQHLYVCGPAAMIAAVTEEAVTLGWPDDAVHFEHFANDRVIDTASTFTVELARSALTVHVQAGSSILSAIRNAGVDLASSCERGSCGTCVATVLEGTPDHQDVYLNRTEKASNRCIVTCVSRAKSQSLVLDL